MTRETRVGLVVAGSFLSLVGGVLAVRMRQGEVPPDTVSTPAEPVAAATATPPAPVEAVANPLVNSPPPPAPMVVTQLPTATPAVAPPAINPAMEQKADPGPGLITPKAAEPDRSLLPAPVDAKPEPIIPPPPLATPVVEQIPPKAPEIKPEVPAPIIPAPVPVEEKKDPPVDPNANKAPAPIMPEKPPEQKPVPVSEPVPEPAFDKVPPPVVPEKPAEVKQDPPPVVPIDPKPTPAPVVPEVPAPVVPKPVEDVPFKSVEPSPKPPESTPPAAPVAKLEKPAMPTQLPDSVTSDIVPAGAGVKPTPPPAKAPANDSYLEEEYRLQRGDDYRAVSRKYYFSEKYADALRQYNRDYPIATAAHRSDAPPAGTMVWVPPIRILERRYSNLLPNVDALPNRAVQTPPLNAAPAARPIATPMATKTTRVRDGGETMQEIARRTLGGAQNWGGIFQLNPTLNPSPVVPIPAGTMLKLPPEAKE